MLELYQSYLSPCAQKVRITLAEKQLDYQSHILDIVAKQNLDPEYLKLNPNGVVPTLVHDGVPIIESSLICEYLDDIFPEPALKPADPFDAYRMRIWTKTVDEKLHPGLGALTWAVSLRHQFLEKGEEAARQAIAKVPDPQRRGRQSRILEQGFDAPDVREAIAVYVEACKKMNKVLLDQPWLSGNDFGLADIAVMPYANALSHYGFTDDIFFAGLPALKAWFEKAAARASFQQQIVDKMPEERSNKMAAHGVEAHGTVKNIAELS